jgi:DNA-binding NtrC family response regulator
VGGEKTQTADVRLICATNRNLELEVENGNFREDLYYRVRVVPIALPPLRERRGDIPLLLDHFLEQAAREGQRSKGIARDAVAALAEYAWPGNVRELQSAVHFALVKSQGQRIQRAHLPEDIRSLDGSVPVPEPPSPERKKGRRKLDAQSVREALAQCSGNKVQAARVLGVGRATLYRFLSKNAGL